MNRIGVTIEWDQPTDPYWLNPDNVKVALEQHCPNTRFQVTWSKGGDPWRGHKPWNINTQRSYP